LSPENRQTDPVSPPSGLTRRGFIGSAASLGAGVGLGYAGRSLLSGNESSDQEVRGTDRVEFYGRYQAGIATPAPEFLSFAAFDLATDSPDDLRDLLQEWTAIAVSLSQGRLYRPIPEGPDVVPSDPGEAVDIGPAALTMTFGFGPTLFEQAGSDRLGLRDRKPPRLADLPQFRGDSLQAARSGGDLCIQACSENPQVAFHAVHTLTRAAQGKATLRWSQDGFGRTSSTSRSQITPRNLMGFKDGTNNIRAEDTDQMDRFVWAGSEDGPVWMTSGSYLVARRIKILFDVWDAISLEGQERAVGRMKISGAPLGQEDENDALNLDAQKEGQPVIPRDAHVRLASPQNNQGVRILRRGYSYSEPAETGSGEIDAGLFFISFQRDPHRQFVPLQKRLADSDALSRHLLHTSSAVFACPGGVEPGGFIGEGLFT
jgi:deferrochelatase/peroxidase EfeB